MRPRPAYLPAPPPVVRWSTCEAAACKRSQRSAISIELFRLPRPKKVKEFERNLLPEVYTSGMMRCSVFPVLFFCAAFVGALSNCSTPGSVEREATSVTRSDAEPEACREGCLSGDCKNGDGRYQFRDCSVYQGQFQNGKRNGSGEYSFASGAYLTGDFSEGEPVGSFRYRFPDGSVFEGEVSEKSAGLTEKGFRINGARGFLIEDGNRQACEVQDLRLFCEGEEEQDVADSGSRREPPPPADLEAEEIRFLILYAPESAVLYRSDREYPISAGFPLAPGDTIETRQHAADIQGEGGFAVRLRPFTRLHIPEDARRTRVLELDRGSVIIDYKGEGPLPFRVRTGGMNVDVKGTTFVVEAADEQNRVTIRVLEGEVELSRDQAVLERVTEADLKKYPGLRDAAEQFKSERISITAGQEARADATDPDSANVAEEIADAKTEVAAADEEALVKDALESTIMPTISEEQFEATREAAASGDEEDLSESRASLKESYEDQVKLSGDNLERNLAASPEIRTVDDFRRTYTILEVVQLRAGTRRAGSIIAQAAGLLFLHAPDGLYRLPINEVQQVDYYNSDEMDLQILREQSKERSAEQPADNDTGDSRQVPVNEPSENP
jgi:hypothetical protein